MEDFFPILMGFLVVTAVLGSIVGSIVMDKRRTRRFEEVAAELQLQFFPDVTRLGSEMSGKFPLSHQLLSFKLASVGRGRRCRNMLFGDAGGMELAIFDYQYTTGSGKNSSTKRQSVMYMSKAGHNFPHFMLRPEWFLDKFGSMLGLQDINFKEHPQFSAAFVLQGQDEDAVRHMFTTDLMNYLMKHQSMTIEAYGDKMIFYRQNTRVSAAEVRAFMQDGFELFGKLVEAANNAQ